MNADAAQKCRASLLSGTKNHDGYEIQRRQANGNGAVISFTTGDAAFSQKIVEGTELFDIVVSFGSVGSVISLPCRMSHKSVPAALREKHALPADLIRIPVGIEDIGDLIEDLERAFAAAIEQHARRLRLCMGGKFGCRSSTSLDKAEK